MSERVKAIWIGIFIIAALVIVAWLLMLLKPHAGDGKQTIKVRFTNIEKVSVGTPVTFAGKPVGEVASIKEIFDARDQPTDIKNNLYFYELILKVDSSVHIYNYDMIIFSSSGLMGERSISIVPRAAPPGCPPAHEVSGDILYAQGGDRLDNALTQLTQVAETMNQAMTGINELIEDNREALTRGIDAFDKVFDTINETQFVAVTGQAFASINTVFQQAIGANLIEDIDCAVTNICSITDAINQPDKLNQTVDNFHKISQQIACGCGTLGKLIYSDAFYLQLTGAMSRIEALVNDINHYGILFQYDKKWQRKRTRRAQEMERLCTPCDFYNYFNDELCEINVSLSRVSMVMETLECSETPINKQEFFCRFRELLERVKNLEEQLLHYTASLCCQ